MSPHPTRLIRSFQRTANISFMPGETHLTLDHIVAATAGGIVIKNRGS